MQLVALFNTQNGTKLPSETSLQIVRGKDPSCSSSHEDIYISESDVSFQDESDGINQDPCSTSNNTQNRSRSKAIVGTTRWDTLKSTSRRFEYTATELLQFTIELPSDRVIEPNDIHKLYVSDEVAVLNVIETNILFEYTIGATPKTKNSKVKHKKPK